MIGFETALTRKRAVAVIINLERAALTTPILELTAIPLRLIKITTDLIGRKHENGSNIYLYTFKYE